MKWWKKRSSLYLQEEALQERTDPVKNPGRGWYHIYTFQPEERNRDQLKWLPFEENETLALVLLNIGTFRIRKIDEETLAFIEEIFARFREKEKQIVLRIVYDTEGKGEEHEPPSFQVVLLHMQQLGALVQKFADGILLTQGLFVGNWGEMHGSAYLTPEHIRVLEQTWRQATGGMVKTSLRKPMFCRMIYKKTQPRVSLGLYDDALFASETHLGTFGEKSRAQAKWEEAWCPSNEFWYMKQKLTEVPCGGEVLSGMQQNTEQMFEQMRQMRLTYLNCVHEEEVLNRWKMQPYEGTTLYDYIGEHLGYRFVVRSAEWEAGSGQLNIRIENTGFAPIYEEALVVLSLEQPDGARTELAWGEYDIRTLDGGSMTELKIKPHRAAQPDTRLYLSLRKRGDETFISFANKGGEKELFLGTLRDGK